MVFHKKGRLTSGIACLRIIAEMYGRGYHLQEIIRKPLPDFDSLDELEKTAKASGFDVMSISVDIKNLKKVPLPCIAFWEKRFIVIYKCQGNTIVIGDPMTKKQQFPVDSFSQGWLTNLKQNPSTGILVLMRPNDNFISENHHPQFFTSLNTTPYLKNNETNADNNINLKLDPLLDMYLEDWRG